MKQRKRVRLKLSPKITLCVEEVPSAFSASMGFFVACGSRHESKVNLGAAHMCEHLFFKRTSSKNANDIARISERLGGELNAYTDRELTCFHADCPADQTEEMLELLFEMLLDPQFNEEEFNSERAVVFQEIMGYEDNSEDVFSDLSLEVPWNQHPLSLRIGARADQVKKLSFKGMHRFIEKTFLVAPWTISVVSPLKTNLVKKIVLNCLKKSQKYRHSSALKKNQKPIRRGGIPNLGSTWSQRSLAHKMEGEQVQVGFSFPSAGIRDAKEIHHTALSSIMGLGAGSMLYRELREKRGLVYHVSAGNFAFTDAGLLMGQWSCTANHLEEAGFTAGKVCGLLAWGGVPENEVKYIRDCLEGVVKMSFDGIRSRMEALGRQEILLGRSHNLSEALVTLKKIKKSPLDRITKQMRKAPCFLIVGPVGKKELTRLEKSWAAGVEAAKKEVYVIK